MRTPFPRGAQGARGKACGQEGLRTMGCDAIPLQRHTHATHSSCDAVQILCSPKLRFSQARTCLAFPKPGVAFAVLYQADAFRSFAMPTPDDSMPLLLYAFPWPSFAKPFPCCSEPCLCVATPRLANALHNRCAVYFQAKAVLFRRKSAPVLCHDRLYRSCATLRFAYPLP